MIRKQGLRTSKSVVTLRREQLFSVSNLNMDFSGNNNNITSANNIATTEWEDADTGNDTFMEEVEALLTFKIAMIVNRYWFSALVPIGLVGNTLSFLVMIKPNNRKVSTCIYMAAISISDNIMMYVCFHVFLIDVLKTHEWHHMECKFQNVIALYALQNGTFLILAMTTDKYIAIKWPHKTATYSTPRRAKMIAVGLSVGAFVYNIPHLFLSSFMGDLCVAYAIDNLITRMYSWFTFVLNAIIPFTLLIYMNFVIVKTVRSSRRSFGDNDRGMDARQKAMKSAENQLTIMLLLVTTLFLILLCPTYVRFIYLSFADPSTPLEYANQILIFQITVRLFMTNTGLNFFLYCISGKKFRNDLKEILCSGNSQLSGNTRSDESQSTEFSAIDTKYSASVV